ncbi:MAG: tRNA pseudouridine(55) synthase TruB [Fidelibacterota bacterium]|nr:MAG: tRNA pseudouridine(55) synthase TruB [Candidatus Neomarinimicrobiota bacterium]
MIDIVQPFWKPKDWTSFDVVKKIRSATGIRKVGHAGTLDPFAEGILLICLGAATKRSSQLMALEKEYIATVKLGSTTDTLDPTGDISASAPVPDLTQDEITPVLTRFTGTVRQIPPMFSALKVDGTRLYKLARAGKSIPRKPRLVQIHTIRLLDWRPPDELEIQVTCGKGTYIRSLAADVAQDLQTVGYVIRLTRTRVGAYGPEDALRLEQLASWTPFIA